MHPRLQRRIQRYGWDKAVSYYESYWKRQLEPAQTRLLEMAELKQGERVLDMACGTGLVTFRAAAQVGCEGAVCGTDISEHMVQSARTMAAQHHTHHAAFERMEAEDLRLPNDSFDVALCALGLMYVPNPMQALREMHRVLQPGGRAVAAVWGQRNRCGWAEIFPIVEARVQSEVCPLFFQLGTHDLLAQTFRDAGFQDVISTCLSTILHYDSSEAACGAAFAGGPVALAYARFDACMREAVHAEYLTSIEAYRTSHGYAIPGEFVITRGCKR